ncbi:PIN domain-containing protein [Myxococcus sp. RHSTA-1-4]|uniref:PIN domain-containing protein n=1 Tax=Myxococcus sp. RHSTA-1-4 TaxID=2874601 RepID=UPI001CBE1145|nr:PIN domain-containing protein [Myxococcus sp. RHSTA-1-4]MBZ4419157.1 PIN domain-containing protein [Myxococcus sp. RHSTA-1-4]
MAFIAVYDACVLFPPPLRDLLVRLALTGLFQAKWTGQILDECFRNISTQRPDLKPELLARSRQLLELAIPNWRVQGYDSLIEGVTGLPDPDDRHVLAAAIRCGAQVIVTFNLRDFPSKVLARFDIEAQHPDDFVRNLLDLDEPAVVRVVQEQAAALKNPRRTAVELLGVLRQQGLFDSVAKLARLLGP